MPSTSNSLDAEPLTGSHDPIRVGSVILVFFASEGRPAEDPDEIAFDVDAAGFDEVLARAQRMDATLQPGTVPGWCGGAF